VNRTERLYALVEELRAVAPRPRSASWLAARFEVSARTVERDLNALREAGTVIWGDVGRAGGYFLDRDRTLPPVMLTAREALAINVALRSAASGPFASAARAAGQKVLAVLPADVRRREEALAEQVHLVGDHRVEPPSPVSDVIEDALSAGRVLHLTYTGPAGARTQRDIEPLGLLWGPTGWYLMGWCRLRGAVRGFALDRVSAMSVSDERTPDRRRDSAAELERLAARSLVP
jgi:predicted DNA-binding transcriptional regulator YafY